MTERIALNDNWQFSETFKETMLYENDSTQAWKEVRLPHSCVETPFSYFDEKEYQMVCTYRKVLPGNSTWVGKRLLLTFEGIAHYSEVFFNGEKIAEHKCGYTAFTVDLSNHFLPEKDNILIVKVDSRESLNVPPFGFVIDYMTYGGIYREAYLEIKEEIFIEDVFLYSEIEDKGQRGQSKEKANAKLCSKIRIAGDPGDCQIRLSICKKDEDSFQEIANGNANSELELKKELQEISLWDVENPNLYFVKTQLLKEDKVLDEKTVTFGFRRAEFKKDGFYLNGRKLKLRGLNRHQSYPYVGYAMPKSMQRMDADILKKELGLNTVRTSHYPQSHHFLNRCDEIGLLVFTEIPGWQHIGNEEWKKQAVNNVKDMVRQYRNHCSIILWGVRINESQDDDDFYRRTNEVAHRLDPTRSTGGVRAHKRSSFLEDVYTYNDFSHNGKASGCEPKKKITSDMNRAYLITEYNGHMFPTKSYDCEEHRVEHMLRHARVLDAVRKNEDIAGCIGWCMFDYNTHKDFGSGDRICYHGVMDMFRNPKLAASVYACQQDEEPVLTLSSSMDIGEHPECNRGNTYILTNADSVRMYKNDRFIKEYTPADAVVKNLSHGPWLVDDYIGDAIEKNKKFTEKQAAYVKRALNATAMYGVAGLPKSIYWIALKLMLFYHMKPTEAVALYNKYVGDWGGASTMYRFEAIKDGRVVKTIVKEPMSKVVLKAYADHTDLVEEDTYDVAAIRITAEDENGNVLPFYQEPICLQSEGDIALIGPDIVSLKGGMGGCYVKSVGKNGNAKLKIKTMQDEEVEIAFTCSSK